MSDLIRAYIAHLKAGGRSPKTIQDRRYLLQRINAELPHGLDEFSTADLEEWLSQWDGWTLCAYHSGIADYSRWATSQGVYEFDPAAELARPRPPDEEPNPASEEQIAHALAHLDGVALVAVELATYDGLRAGEVARLDRQQVTGGGLRVRRKGRREQTLPTHPIVWTRVRPLPPGPVVRTPTGLRYRPAHLSATVSAALTRIGLPDLTLHRFRASFATRLAAAGVHARVIQDLMGHASLATTQRYVQVTDGQRRDAITALPAANAEIASSEPT